VRLPRPSALLLALLSLAGAQEAPRSDGPYVFTNGKSLVVRTLVDGAVREETDPADGVISYVVDGNRRRVTVRRDPGIPKAVHDDADRVVVVGDPHGHAKGIVEILRTHGVVDKNLDWALGKGRFVVVGDIFDRGDAVNECLWLLYDLEQQAEKAGGRVHVVLGNHEDFILRADDERYVHPRCQESAKRLGKGYCALYGKDTVLGRWLRTRNIVEKIGGTVFVHGGIEPALFKEKADLEALNKSYRTWLDGGKVDERTREVLTSLLWYRGYFSEDGRPEPAEIDRILGLFGAARIVVGHTTQKQILPVYGNARVIGVDAGRCELGEALILEKGVPWRGKKDGNRVRLAP
jgi:hypothetical protein